MKITEVLLNRTVSQVALSSNIENLHPFLRLVCMFPFFPFLVSATGSLRGFEQVLLGGSHKESSFYWRNYIFRKIN